MSKKKIIKNKDPLGQKLTLKQQMFCRLFALDPRFRGNATQCYGKAYGLWATKKRPGKGYEVTVRRQAHKLISNPNVKDRINKILDQSGFNDINVDTHLLSVIEQQEEFGSKVSAIKVYNDLKKRVDSGDKNSVCNKYQSYN